MIMLYMYQINMLSLVLAYWTRGPHDEVIMFYMYQINMISLVLAYWNKRPTWWNDYILYVSDQHA